MNELELVEKFQAHFPIHTDKGINSKEFEEYKIELEKANSRKQRVVKVNSGHCGVGKSRRLFHEWEKLPNKKKMYMSHSHIFLSEQAKRVNGSRHIQGLRRTCPYRIKNNETGFTIKNLLDLGLSNKIVCGFCKKNKFKYSDKTKCTYKKQFIDMPNTVMLPIEYGFTHLLENYKPDIIAIDDCLLRKKNHRPFVELEKFFNIANIWCENQIKDSIVDLLNSETFDSDIHQYQETWDDAINRLISFYGDDFIIPYSNYNFEDIKSYRKYSKIYGMLKQFATANLFPIFDYMFRHTDDSKELDEVPQVVLVEAMPNEQFLQDIADMYFRETGNIIHLDFEVIEPEIIPDSKFYRCATYEGNWYPSTASIVESATTRAKIKEHIQQILDGYYKGGENCKIGIMIPKKCKVGDFIDTNKYKNVLDLRFGNQRGKNELEYCNPYFVIGTYLINKNEIEKDYELWFKEKPENLDTYQQEHQKSRWRFKDAKLDNFRSMFEEEEQYHASFRSRALTYDREVFCFGLIPEEIEQIFGKEKIKNLTFNRKVKYQDGKRLKFLYDIIEKHNNSLPEKEVRKIAMEFYDIEDETARRWIKELVEKTDNLEFSRIKIGRNNPKHIVKRGK